MRVLIADRNARLLESISRTFAQQFSIQTATTHEQCNELLRCDEFDLAVISEKLADGRGLQLLGQIARSSPDTLRVFAARRQRLELLEDKLAPFALLRTLTYPIDPQELLSALTLACSGLEQRAGVSIPAPAVVRPIVEHISLTSADATFATNVPMTIASMEQIRRSNSSSGPRLAPIARQGAPASDMRNVVPELPSEPPPSQNAASLQSIGSRLTRAQHAVPQSVLSQAPGSGAAGSQVVSLSTRRRPAQGSPLRTKVVLAATVAAVFVVTTLTLNLVDSSVHLTRASAPRPELEQPDISPQPRNSTPVSLPPPSPPRPAMVAQHVEPKPDAPKLDEEPATPQTASSASPIADPSTFGSEAYEPIYTN